jgi:hypothetical protein
VLSTVTVVLTLSALANGTRTSKYAAKLVTETKAPVRTVTMVIFPALNPGLLNQREKARISFGIVQNNLITVALQVCFIVGINHAKNPAISTKLGSRDHL